MRRLLLLVCLTMSGCQLPAPTITVTVPDTVSVRTAHHHGARK